MSFNFTDPNDSNNDRQWLLQWSSNDCQYFGYESNGSGDTLTLSWNTMQLGMDIWITHQRAWLAGRYVDNPLMGTGLPCPDYQSGGGFRHTTWYHESDNGQQYGYITIS